MTDPTQCPAGNSVTQMELCCGNYTTIYHFIQNIIQQTGDRGKVIQCIINYSKVHFRGKLRKHIAKCKLKNALSSPVLIFLTPIHPKSALFYILLCLMPDNFTHQRETP